MLAEPPVKRAIAFFDGQNLFHAVKAAFGYTYPNYVIVATNPCYLDRSVLASMNIALGDLAPRVEEVRHVLELDALRASLELNRRPARAHGKWLRPGRLMGERVARPAAG